MLNAVKLETVYTPVFLNNIFLETKNKNKDPCCGLRLLYMRI